MPGVDAAWGACWRMNHRLRTARLAAVLLLCLSPLPSAAQTPQPELNRFENGEVADAEEVNENFDRLLQRIEALEAAVGTGNLDRDNDGVTPAAGDCDDGDPGVFPGAAEVCDGIDNDCSGSADDGAADATCSSFDSTCAVGRCLTGGVCGAVGANAGATCRASTGSCDAAEVCDGVSTQCPADTVEPGGTICRASAGACDAAEFCDGVSAQCPADGVQPSGTVCRALAGSCDLAAEVCDGVSAQCPADAFEPSSTVCRASAGICDLQETCTGSSGSCPSDRLKGNSAVCQPAGECFSPVTCGGSPDCPLDAPNPRPAGTFCGSFPGPCKAGFCNGSGGCLPGNLPDGTPCGPSPSSINGVCSSGVCILPCEFPEVDCGGFCATSCP